MPHCLGGALVPSPCDPQPLRPPPAIAQDGSPEIFALGTLLPDLLERAAERCRCLATEGAQGSYCKLVLAPGGWDEKWIHMVGFDGDMI